jgi:uncharacterized membrane protein HdeD (DUF308 family)
MIEAFLLGVIVTASLLASLFFLKFWRQTRDPLFLAFGVALLLEGINRMAFLFVAVPNDRYISVYVIRLAAFLLILAGILHKGARESARGSA